VGTGSREENASNQESRAPFRFNRNGAQRKYRKQPHAKVRIVALIPSGPAVTLAEKRRKT
jgi:hypothetical protein